MRLIFVITICTGLWSCSRTTDTQSSVKDVDSLSISDPILIAADTVLTANVEYATLFELESYLVNDAIEDSLLEIVDFDCAILIYPTEEQIEEMIKTEGEEDFYVGADDSNWYQGMAIQMMDSVGIKQISASGQYLRLKGPNESWDLDIRKKNLPAWNLIFFKRTKEPKIVSTIDLTMEEVKVYFGTAE
jgi:hypothetical protein